MKKFTLIATIFCLTAGISNAQDIATARTAAVGASVTFRGVALNGTELASIRYIQDATAGIAIYGSNTNSIHAGDSVLVTGTMTNYNNLEEISPATFTVLGSVAMPAAQVITDVTVINDDYESELLRFNNCTFSNGGALFSGNTNYTVTIGSQTFQARITNGSPLVGQVIPTGVVDLTGIMSQYCYDPTTGCTTGYQLLLRTTDDIVSASSINLTSAMTTSAILTDGFDINWSTNIAGTNSYIKYGLTPDLELGMLASNNAVNHTVSLTGLTPGTIYYVKAWSFNTTDSAVTLVKPYATQSLSSGSIKCYFNRFQDNTVSTGVNSKQLNFCVADTMAAYINRAQLSIDIAMYNWDDFVNATKIINAVNAAHTRGVKVRIINDGSTANSAMDHVDPAIPVLTTPQGPDYTIMHNKFVIMDANAANPNMPVLWTGSTNFTNDQLLFDANNVIIFQDQSIARGYKMEFDEMWGDTTQSSQPNMMVSRFGEFKKDNTPHEYVIGGKRVESYFSPSDQTNSQILRTIGTADHDLHFAVMTITRTDLAYALHDRIADHSLDAKGMVDNEETSMTPYGILHAASSMGSNMAESHQTWIFHHKYMIVDEAATSSDPLVLTGSHNWSSAAETQNDENTVIVHDASIANQYYQDFMGRWCERNGINCVAGLNELSDAGKFVVYPNPNNGTFSMQVIGDGKTAAIRIFDISGKQLYSADQPTSNGINTLEVATSSLVKGTYFVQLTVNGQSATQQIVVQ